MPLTDEDKQKILATADALECKASIGWRNFTGSEQNPQAIVVDFESKRTLRAFMQALQLLNRSRKLQNMITCRVAAGGIAGDQYSQSYSFTDCASSDLIIRLTGPRFRRINKVNGRNNVVHVGASAQIGTLDEALYQKHNLALPTSSLIPYVTVGGLLATGGHGTGRDQPSFSGLVVAMTFMLPDGRIKRISNRHPDFKTIRAAHLGLFGILLSADLRCVPAKKLKCVRDVMSLPDFIDKTNAGLFRANERVSVMYTPTYYDNELEKRDVNNTCIYTWEEVDLTTPDLNNCPEWLQLTQKIQIGLADNLDVMELLKQVPSLIPYYMRYIASNIIIGDEDKVAIGPWPVMAHFQREFPDDITEIEVIFPVGKYDQEIVAACEYIVRLLKKYADNGNCPIGHAIFIRYLQGTNGGLSTTDCLPGERVCAIDLTTSKGFPGFHEFQQELRDHFIKYFGAKIHFGKNFPDINYETMFGPNYDVFLEAYDSWYRSADLKPERNPLCNGFTDRLLSPALGEPTQRQRRTIPAPLVTNSTIELANKVVSHVHTHNEAGEILRKRLQGIGALHGSIVRAASFSSATTSTATPIAPPREADKALQQTNHKMG